MKRSKTFHFRGQATALSPAANTSARLATRGRDESRGGLTGLGWRTELVLFLSAYGVYNLARWVFVGDLAEAKDHAMWILELERDLSVAVEGSVQSALDSSLVSTFFSYLYLAAQLVVLPAALVWLYRRSHEIYRTLRNTVLATWMLAVPIYALFPVAPPRLLDLGFVDTVSVQAGVELTGRSTLLYNPLAAVPSLHAGFAIAIGFAVAAAVRPLWAKALALSWGPLVSLSVVVTGNHYVFDIAAGMAVTAAGYLAARAIERRGRAGREGPAALEPQAGAA